MHTVEIRSDDWGFQAVLAADTFYARWRGLRPQAGGRVMWIRGRSITTFGMREPLGWAAVDRSGSVLAVGVARPRRIVYVPGATAYLEFDPGRRPPNPGAHLSIVAACPAG